MTFIGAGLLVLVTSCGATPAPQGTQPAATSPVVSTVQPTGTASAPETKSASEPTVSTAQPASSGEFTPKIRSIWNTAVGLDQMQGTCPKGSLLPVYGLVQVTPNGDTLAWKNQEPNPYTMTRLQPNVYQYAGPSAIKDGVVTMTVKFLSDKALEMNRVFIANTDPGCTHTHVYTGTYQWDKP
ncbi:MAG TPA: hypothetical protein VGK87_01990 [Anaerolineae bacterium]